MSSGSLRRAPGLLALANLVIGCSDETAAATSTGTGPTPVCELPQGNPHVVAIEGALGLHMALWSDGRLRCWGDDDFNLCARAADYNPYNIGTFEAGGVSCLSAVQFEGGNVVGVEAWSPPRSGSSSVVLWGAAPELFVTTDAFGVGRIETAEPPALVSADGPLLVYGPESGLFWKGTIVIDDEVPPNFIRADGFTPVALPGPVVDLSTDGAACAVLADGRLYCWGYGPNGELGLGDSSVSIEPALVASPEPLCEVDQGVDWMCARACSGAVYCTGKNTFGQIDPSGPERVRSLSRIEGLPPLDAISLEGFTGCGIGAGELWCWGERELLTGEAGSAPPSRVADFIGVADLSLADGSSLCALRQDGTVWCDGEPSAHARCGAHIDGWQQLDFSCGAP